jgi:CubicO group peptidase (beta-lactamase class C family)
MDSEIDEYIKKRHYRQINSVLIWKNNEVLAQRYYNSYDENSRNVIKSVAKSIMSICTGIALDKGLIKSLDEPIFSFIPEFNENRDPRHRLITIRHLLTMTSGIYWNGGIHYHCPMMSQMRNSGNWISHIANCAVSDTPGTKYNYKEWDIILLARLLDVVCGNMYDYINDNLYKPLGINSNRWYRSDCGISYSVALGDEGESEIQSSLTALEMHKIGRLFLYGGVYEGKRIISEDYIKQAVAPSKCNSGYGLLWWRGDNWYGCRGFGGQSITVVPDKNAVIVTQATPTSRGMGYNDVIQLCMSCI